MSKTKSLLEKVWWVIPPVVVLLLIIVIIPLLSTFTEMISFALPIGSFIYTYTKNLIHM
jgi:hypothetical protein